MTIAICDDDLNCLKQLACAIKDYYSTHAQKMVAPNIHTFQSGVELLESYTYRKYDFVFLDIDMPEINGMDLAAKIRNFDKHAQITFVTFLENQLPYGYRVMASGFVVKPFTQHQIDSVLNDMMSLIDDSQNHYLELNLKGAGTVTLQLNQVLYFESHLHYLIAVDSNGSQFEFQDKISSLESFLSQYDFVRIHRSYLVNLAYVYIRDVHNIRLTSGKILPVSR